MKMSKTFRLWITLTVVTCLAACGATQVKVSPILEFPTPLIDPLPVHVGVYYTQKFRHFVYEEAKDAQGDDDTIIALGPAQVSLFDRILPAVFEQVRVLEKGEPHHLRKDLDGVLVLQVMDVEYSVPRKSKAKIYEVWIKYQFDLLAPDGSTIAVWTMPAYGKTPTAFLKSDKEAINLASLMALRDSGAAFITGFHQVPEVAQWLDRSIQKSQREIQFSFQEIHDE